MAPIASHWVQGAGGSIPLVFSSECSNMSALVKLLHNFWRWPEAASGADEVIEWMGSYDNTAFAMCTFDLGLVPVFHYFMISVPKG